MVKVLVTFTVAVAAGAVAWGVVALQGFAATLTQMQLPHSF